jgi:HK97 family phage prohead protease
VHGIVVPFGRTALVSDGGPRYEEGFDRGAFAKTIRERGDKVKLLSQHNSRANPLGRATLLREDTEGLYGEFRVSQTASGDEALELVRDGALDSFSIGFAPIKHVKRGRVTWRTEVGLRETSLVTFPAYDLAMVGGVRTLDELTDPERQAVEHLMTVGYNSEDAVDFVLTHTLRSTTPEGEPGGLGTSTDAAPVDEPVSTTPLDVSKSFRSLRRLAREKGVL